MKLLHLNESWVNMAHGALWVKKEIYRQDLILLRLLKEKGKKEERSVEQYLEDTVAELEKVCK